MTRTDSAHAWKRQLVFIANGTYGHLLLMQEPSPGPRGCVGSRAAATISRYDQLSRRLPDEVGPEHAVWALGDPQPESLIREPSLGAFEVHPCHGLIGHLVGQCAACSRCLPEVSGASPTANAFHRLV